jgi:hypothetical protein
MKLAGNTKSKGYGPQSPRDIEAVAGDNLLTFNTAPLSTQMNLCNIHFIILPDSLQCFAFVISLFITP